MLHRSGLALVAAVALGPILLDLPALAQLPKAPSWSHAFDLKCRSSKEPKFSDKTRTFGLEVFRDDNNGKGIYIIDTGVLAGVASLTDFKGSTVKSRSPEWFHGLDLKVRPPGTEDFGKARTFGLEVFRDENTGNWIYICEVGSIAVASGGRSAKAPPTESPKALKFVHGLDLKVRKAGEKKFKDDTAIWSIEVFLDENTGNLIYICNSGNFAIVPGFKDLITPTPTAKEPAWLHGLDLKVRKGGMKDFDGQTKAYGVEVFRDDNNGNLIYITEAGSLAIVPGKQALMAPTPKDKLAQPHWTHGLDLKCRKFGQKDFNKEVVPYGIEVFQDPNTDCTLYICETGAITAVPK